MMSHIEAITVVIQTILKNFKKKQFSGPKKMGLKFLFSGNVSFFSILAPFWNQKLQKFKTRRKTEKKFENFFLNHLSCF